jgi:hypothetical protein
MTTWPRPIEPLRATPQPNFLIIGAGRSGTTSLYEYLRQHPQVYMSRMKEPSYFAFAGDHIPDSPGAAWLRANSVTTREAYDALFADAGNARAIGEASPQYLIREHAAERIHAALPGVRLAAILRHPVERAFSSYLAHVRDGWEPELTFEGAIADQNRRAREGWVLGRFIDYGLVMSKLAPYRRLFPAERLRIYLYDDLVTDPIGLIRDLLTYLDVDPAELPDMSLRHGSTGLIRNPILRAIWRHSPKVRPLAARLIPGALRSRVYRWAMRDLERPPLRPETRAHLLALFRDDTLALQDLLGRDLSAWLK